MICSFFSLMPSYDGLEPLFPVHMDVDYVRVYREFRAPELARD